jgi:DnaJ family protein C protein 7
MKEIQTVKLAAIVAKRKDYYKILDVLKTATGDEIRKAYKKRALIHHPGKFIFNSKRVHFFLNQIILIADRHASNTTEVQREQEKAFKDVGEAYEVLSDSKKRFRYDNEQDLKVIGGFYDPYEANKMFNMFFSSEVRRPAGGMGGGRGPADSSSSYARGGGGCSSTLNAN